MHAIYLAAMAPKVDGNAFLIGDKETVTWLDFYRPLMDSLGIDPRWIPILPFPEKVRFWRDPYSYVRSSEMLSQALLSLPPPVRNGLRSLNFLWRQRVSVDKTEWITTPPANVVPSLERALLHRCQYKFPWTKAAALLGYAPEISFEEGCRRSIAWLEFAGFPVVQVGRMSSGT